MTITKKTVLDTNGNPIDFSRPRVLVTRATDGMQLGTMPAQVGMVTSYGEIAKINEKSITLVGGDRISSGAVVHFRIAQSFGWPKIDGCNDLTKKGS